MRPIGPHAPVRMQFGAVPTSKALDCVLAHTVRLGSGILKKGTLLRQVHLERLEAADITEVVVARPEEGDLLEDAAAARLARSLAGDHVRLGDAFTGRCNVTAGEPGLVSVDERAIRALNEVGEVLTLSTLGDGTQVRAGDLVATIKVLPFAVAETHVAEWERLVDREPPVSVRPFRTTRVALLTTHLPGMRAGHHAPFERRLSDRLSSRGSSLPPGETAMHESADVARALQRMLDAEPDGILVVGATQPADRADVVPAAIENAGGSVTRFGLPMDPGNLTVVGSIGSTWVIGVPGCARSPRSSGFDRVLNEALVGGDPCALDFGAMGVGGLLKEVAQRPQPRNPPAASAEAGAIIPHDPTDDA